ncbi:TPA: hypothetical protein ACJJD1_000121 [Neisseria meningitidis]
MAKGGRREVKKTKAAADMPCAICRTAGQQDCRGVGIFPFTTLILRDIRQILWEVSAFAYNASYLTNFVNFIKRNKRWLPSTTKLKK